jgi:hypothetical protein
MGAVISMAILLLTIQHWTFEVAAFPIFIVCVASVEVVLVGLEPGPRLRRSRQRDGSLAEPTSPA